MFAPRNFTYTSCGWSQRWSHLTSPPIPLRAMGKRTTVTKQLEGYKNSLNSKISSLIKNTYFFTATKHQGTFFAMAHLRVKLVECQLNVHWLHSALGTPEPIALCTKALSKTNDLEKLLSNNHGATVVDKNQQKHMFRLNVQIPYDINYIRYISVLYLYQSLNCWETLIEFT